MPVTPVATWDNDLFGCPDPRDYQITHETMQRANQPIEGTARYRRILEQGFYSLSLRVQQTPEQYQAFRQFYFLDINSGEDWFNMPLLVGVDIETLIVHIVDGFAQSRNDTVYGYYLTTFALDAVRIPSVVYTPPVETIKDSTGPANPSLGILDVRDGTSPDNPALGTLDVSDPNAILDFPT